MQQAGHHGLFVVCEGLDRAGKTTSIKEALSLLRIRGYDALYSKGLMTSTAFGRLARWYPSTPTLLLDITANDYTQIRPALDAGALILQDRWYPSVLFHHPSGLLNRVMYLPWAAHLTPPDIYVHITVSLEERLTRLMQEAQNRGHQDLLTRPERIIEREKHMLIYMNTLSCPTYILDTTGKTSAESGKVLADLLEPHIRPDR